MYDTKWMGERLRRPAKWVRAHISSIPHYKIGGRYRFTEKHLETYLRSVEVSPSDPLRPTRAPRARGRR